MIKKFIMPVVCLALISSICACGFIQDVISDIADEIAPVSPSASTSVRPRASASVRQDTSVRVRPDASDSAGVSHSPTDNSDDNEPSPSDTPVVEVPDYELEDYLINELERLSTEIDVSAYQISPDDISYIYLDLLEKYPEMFYVDTLIEWGYYEGGFVNTVYPKYTARAATIEKQRDRFNAALDEALSEIPAGLDPIETVTAVNDWICKNAEYDQTLEGSTAYDLLVGGTGVCEAYTAAFGVFMKYYGINYRVLKSDAMNHAWNQVKIKGEWLHVDVTWDDPVPDEPGRALHDYLLLTDDELSSMPEAHYDWY